MILVKPIVSEQWVSNGVPQGTPSNDSDALYIKPMLPLTEFAVPAQGVHHTMVLDNNVLKDLLEDRRPLNNKFLENLFRSIPVELNPVFAMTEQRQKYAKASEDIVAFANYLKKTFNYTISAENIGAFETLLESSKAALIDNIDGLSGYLSAIIYLYHQNCSAAKKLEWLAGLILGADLPIFQLHFYFAGLVFLAKENPSLFQDDDLKKVRVDMKIAGNFEKQKEKILNLSNDLALPTTSIFQGGIKDEILVFPYVATRDRLCKLFLSQITCEGVANTSNGRVNGIWRLHKGRLLESNLGQAISHLLPVRSAIQSREDHLSRKSKLKAFTDLYTRKLLEI